MVYILPRCKGCSDCAEYQEIHLLCSVSFQELSFLAGGNDPLSPPSPYLADNYFFPWRDLCLFQLEVGTFGEVDISVEEMDISGEADNLCNFSSTVPVVVLAENVPYHEGHNLRDNHHLRSYCHLLAIFEQHLRKGWKSHLYFANYQRTFARVFVHFCEYLVAIYVVPVFFYLHP